MTIRSSVSIVQRIVVDLKFGNALTLGVRRSSSQAAQASVTQASFLNERHAAPKSLVQGFNFKRPSCSLCVSESYDELHQQSGWPLTRTYKSDLVVVLDMDECLLHSQFISPHQDVPDNYRQYEAERSSRSSNKRFQNGVVLARQGHNHSIGNGTLECQNREHSTTVALFDESELDTSSPVVDSFCITLPDGDVVVVNKRPFLHEFLKEITSRYETHIFTAAMKVYAAPVLDVLDPNKAMLSKRFYRDSCSVHEELGVYVKDLKNVFGAPQQQKMFDERRVVLVDNNPLSFLANPSNGILVSNFYDDPYDETLPAVLDLIEELDQLEDVRPRLQQMFGLENALASLAKVEKG